MIKPVTFGASSGQSVSQSLNRLANAIETQTDEIQGLRQDMKHNLSVAAAWAYVGGGSKGHHYVDLYQDKIFNKMA